MFMKFFLINFHNSHGFQENIIENSESLQKICINLKNIDTVIQSGRYEAVPAEQIIPEQAGNDVEVRERGLLRQQRQRAQRQPQIFIVDEDRFIIYLKNNNMYTVKGSFDEFCDILTNFREKLETV